MASQKSKLRASAAARCVDPDVARRERGEFAGDAARRRPAEVQDPVNRARGPPSDAPPVTQQWLTKAHAAAYLGVSTMSVERYANEPGYAHLNFPRPSIVVDRFVWNRDDLDAWMRSRVGAVSSRKAKADA